MLIQKTRRLTLGQKLAVHVLDLLQQSYSGSNPKAEPPLRPAGTARIQEESPDSPPQPAATTVYLPHSDTHKARSTPRNGLPLLAWLQPVGIGDLAPCCILGWNPALPRLSHRKEDVG